MTAYKIVIKKAAQKFIDKQQMRILSAIKNLPYSGDIDVYQGHSGYFRLRVGDYRILYTVENDVLTVTVTNAGNRGQIYKC